MTSNRILQLNAAATAASALVMFLTRGMLYPLFGLDGPWLLDIIAAGFLAYAGALFAFANRSHVTRTALLAFTAADGLWVAGSVVVLAAFWGELTPLGRALVIAVAIVVDVFAMLQFQAARRTAETATAA